ncbi:MAG: acetyltransferase [Elusimicrobia bacterium]|nr:acetyltransferase [Elusimicrobiota bacterium]
MPPDPRTSPDGSPRVLAGPLSATGFKGDSPALNPYKKIVIVGAGSQARYAIDNFLAQGAKPAGLIDVETKKNVGQKINGVAIAAFYDDIAKHFTPKSYQVIIAYGDNAKKRELALSLTKKGYRFVSAIHPSAVISSFAEVQKGVIINAGAVVMPNAAIGRHAIIHSQCVIEHDNQIGAFANIAPGVSLAGRVTVGEGSYVYTGASVIAGITIGKNAVVAAGAVVTKNVPDGGRVAGVPARPMAGSLAAR